MMRKARPSERLDPQILDELILAFPTDITKSEHKEEAIDQRFVNVSIKWPENRA